MQTNPIQINVVDNQPVVSTLVVAQNVLDENSTKKDVSLKNHNIVKTIKNNIKDFEEFGVVEFQILPAYNKLKDGKQNYNAKDITVAELNEQQATLLITYLRNNNKVREFKKNLVKAFFMMKEKLEGSSLNINNKVLLDFMKNQQQTNELMINFMQNQTKLLETLVNKDEQKIRTITKEQMKKIRANHYIIAGIIKECKPCMSDTEIMKQLYSELNARMGVSSYYDIAYDDYSEVEELQQKALKRWEDKRELQDKQAKVNLAKDLKEIMEEIEL